MPPEREPVPVKPPPSNDGMATDAAANLAGLPEAELNTIGALLAPDTQKTLTANWPQ
jgi:hypothetical protein